jgi:hypothetical protein
MKEEAVRDARADGRRLWGTAPHQALAEPEAQVAADQYVVLLAHLWST